MNNLTALNNNDTSDFLLKKNKSKKNKTIDFDLDDGKDFFDRCIKINTSASVNEIVNKTIYGDSLTVMECLPHSFIDLAIIDPPYNLSKNYHGNIFSKTNEYEYYKYTEQWIKKLKPLLKENATIYVCCDWKCSFPIFQILNKYFKIQNRITWQREKGRGAKANWKNSIEDIWFATNSNDFIFNLNAVKQRKKVVAPYKENGKPKDWEISKNGNFRDTCPSNFWDDITIPYWSMKENTAHPTQKPEKLIAKLILASSDKKNIVFDPFLGSGTTSVVAKKLNRNYIGIEQNKLYCAWAEYRLDKAKKNNEIQGFSDGVFWERNSLSEQQKHKTPKGLKAKQIELLSLFK